jgi:16S rRNA (uracil1498-N3)-methyltransferase
MVGRSAATVTARRVVLADLEPGEKRVDRNTGHYLAHVLRLQAGDTFIAFDPATAKEADSSVLRVDGASMTIRVGSLRDGVMQVSQAIAWVQGLAKGDKCDAVVRDATELGVARVVLSATSRSIPSFDPKRARARRQRWMRIAEQAARQCGRSDAPIVDVADRWADALDSCKEVDARFCLWERATEPLAPPLCEALARRDSLAFACGAEGGLGEDEVGLARDRGWTVASMGPLILRTETVAAAALGAVRVLGGLFGQGGHSNVAPPHDAGAPPASPGRSRKL